MPPPSLTRLLPLLLVLWAAVFFPQNAGGDPINSVDVTGAGVQDYGKMTDQADAGQLDQLQQEIDSEDVSLGTKLAGSVNDFWVGLTSPIVQALTLGADGDPGYQGQTAGFALGAVAGLFIPGAGEEELGVEGVEALGKTEELVEGAKTGSGCPLFP